MTLKSKRLRNKSAQQEKKPADPSQYGKNAQKWTDIAKDNPRFLEFYKAQNMLPEHEWDAFMTALKTELPASFRITGSRDTAMDIREMLHEKYFSELQTIDIDGERLDPPSVLPFYPNGLAFQYKATRRQIRSHEPLKKLHQLLVAETEIGNITRQETVSMIPPLFMDVQPHHNILDMCAAPGSKTSQIVDMMHGNLLPHEIPSGTLVANDVDTKRSYLLVHQVKRLASPCLMVTNYDSSMFPTIHVDGEPGGKLKFDRILADVPCSGDGTMRKNPTIWRKWGFVDGLGLHPLQVRLLNRAVQLLKSGGRIVYSTCSLNPIENEAVIAEALRLHPSLRLVDVSAQFPELKRAEGLANWKVFSKAGVPMDKFEVSPSITASMFTPADENIRVELKKCMRVFPHYQDTGAFFIAVLEKQEAAVEEEVVEPVVDEQVTAREQQLLQELEAQSDDGRPTSSRPAKKAKLPDRFVKEEPFLMLPTSDQEVLAVQNHFKISGFPLDQFLVRSSEGKNRSIYFVSKGVSSIISNPVNEKLKIVNTGIKAFGKSSVPKEEVRQKEICVMRLHAEILPFLMPFIHESLIFDITKDDLLVALADEYPYFNKFSEPVKETLETIKYGACVMRYKCHDGKALHFSIWRAKFSINVLLNLQERESYLTRLFGHEVATEAMAQRKKGLNDTKTKEAIEDKEASAPEAPEEELVDN